MNSRKLRPGPRGERKDPPSLAGWGTVLSAKRPLRFRGSIFADVRVDDTPITLTAPLRTTELLTATSAADGGRFIYPLKRAEETLSPWEGWPASHFTVDA